MNDKQTCFGCDYAFNVEELTQIDDPQFPTIIKLCADCMKEGE